MEVYFYNGRIESVEVPNSFKDEFEASLQAMVNNGKQPEADTTYKKKYVFTEKEIKFKGKTLKQIFHIKDQKVGGFIEKEENLSQDGHCWIDETSMVYGDVCVRDNSTVSNFSEVSGYGFVEEDSMVNSSTIQFSEDEYPSGISGQAYISNSIIIGSVDIGDEVYITGCNITTHKTYDNKKSSIGIFGSVRMEEMIVSATQGKRHIINGSFGMRKGLLNHLFEYTTLNCAPSNGSKASPRYDVAIYKDFSNQWKVCVYQTGTLSDFSMGAFSEFKFLLPKEVENFIDVFHNRNVGIF